MPNFDIIVDEGVEFDSKKRAEFDPQAAAEKKLASWVMNNVTQWEDYRNTNFEKKWNEYYRLWRGVWSAEDKTRDTERSKLIAPALSQAIESTVAELEEASFGKGKWFDLSDDILDDQKEDAYKLRDMLHEDMERDNVPGAISEIYLNGAIFGTGIGKIIVSKVAEKKPIASAISSYQGREFSSNEDEIISVSLEAIPPMNFAIDPTARRIDEALGCAVTLIKPKHDIASKQKSGLYKNRELGDFIDDVDHTATGETKSVLPDSKVKITEYFGLVPRELLEAAQEEGDVEEEFVDLGFNDPQKSEFVEALVTIANDSILLKAVENPYEMKDRPILAYQHDTVPNRFWGRGIAEKGYNPQKALDAELRARIDALALTSHPMMAADATRLPRGMRLTVSPGNTILTNGNPTESLMPFNFGNISPSTFHQSGELERMIQMGTGAMDSATPTSQNARNQTASGMSMIASGAIKRNKRTMQNIERNLLRPLINKSLWRYMQFFPEKYEPNDYKLVPHGTMGIMAREYEQQQLTNLLSTVPPASPAYWLILQGIFDNSSVNSKEQMMSVLNQQIQQAMNPQPPPPDPMVQVKMQELQLKAQEFQLKAQVEERRLKIEEARIQLESQGQAINSEIKKEELIISASKADAERVKKEADSILAIAKAESEEIGRQLEIYNAQVESLKGETTELTEKASSAAEKVQSDNTEVLSKLEELMKKQEETNKKISDLEKIKQEVKVITQKAEKEEGMFSNSDSSGEIDKISNKIDAIASTLSKHIKEVSSPKKIERDENGKVISINGKKPKRNKDGLIEEI